MTKDELTDLVQNQEPFLRACFRDTGKVIPMLVIVKEDEVVPIVFAHFGDEEKAKVHGMFQAAACLSETVAIMFMSEVWISPPALSEHEMDDRIRKAGGRVSLMPDKGEGVLVEAAARHGTMSKLWRIIRDDGPVRLGEQIIPDDAEVMSRFTRGLVWATKDTHEST